MLLVSPNWAMPSEERLQRGRAEEVAVEAAGGEPVARSRGWHAPSTYKAYRYDVGQCSVAWIVTPTRIFQCEGGRLGP